ncbi:MAG: adenine deaminase [Chloroflexota bacterium]
MTPVRELIAVAQGQADADLVLKNGRVVNTVTGTVESADVAISGDTIAAVGSFSRGREIIDLQGAFLLPGLIDGHTHIESSMLHPARYAEAVVPRGTLTVVTDLHEIANVAGMAGIQFCMEWATRIPLDMKFMAPSCVPATPLETSGATISQEEIQTLLARPDVIGLGEMMNYPGVIAGLKDVLAKLDVARGRPIDGHAPGLTGAGLDAYIAAGVMSDHECTQYEEAIEKLSKGMYLMLREGSSEKNLEALLPAVTDATYTRCMLVIDDRSAADLDSEGDMDHVVRRAISLGMEPVRAIQLATVCPANYFRLWDRGFIGPGKKADLITTRDLTEFRVDRVYRSGSLVAAGGEALFSTPPIGTGLTGTVRTGEITADSLRLPDPGGEYPVIELVPGQILTRRRQLVPTVRSGSVVSDTERDLLKLVVVERHHASGAIGKGLVHGFGLTRGALATSIAHDSHNLVAVGVDDADILGALRALVEMEGGLVVFADNEVKARLPLPVAGLLSQEPLATVLEEEQAVQSAARTLGPLPSAPFALLSFLALPVIPELRVTDQGVVDVAQFKVIA